jgi:hypothetical protein
LTTAISGRERSSSVRPAPRNIALAGALAGPLVIASDLLCFNSAIFIPDAGRKNKTRSFRSGFLEDFVALSL